jgi:hypothetical protein
VQHRRAEDALDAFVSEDSLPTDGGPKLVEVPRSPVEKNAAVHRKFGLAFLWVLLIAGGGAGVGWAVWAYQQPETDARLGSFTLQTTPPGLQVRIQGKASGATPLTVSLPGGDYAVELATPDGGQRTFTLTLPAGGTVVRQVEIAASASSARTGALRVDTTPSGQSVVVDGVDRGVSPVTVPSLAAGEHTVLVRSQNTTLRRTVSVSEGETVSLVVAVPAEGGTLRAGWVTFSSPITLSFLENGRVFGTTAAERLMLPAGDHDIEMTNDALGFRATRRITVAADRTTAVSVAVPDGVVNINALPWAEVWVDGERVGETPIANLSRPIGSHEVVLRHPQFGERRARVTVSLKETARLGVDMRVP